MLTVASNISRTPVHLLLKRISEILAKPQTLPSRLVHVLKEIADDFGAETGILYLLTEDRLLDPYAVHDVSPIITKKIPFRVGEGVVGFIAATEKSLLSKNITRHPNFFFSPGFAEHINLSLVGAPIISPRGVIGVLTLQNPPSKPFEPHHEKSLIEIAAFLANLNELERFPALNASENRIEGMHMLQGIPFNHGLAIGTAVIHQPCNWQESTFSDNPKEESLKLKAAIRDMIESIDKMVQNNLSDDKQTLDVLSSYKMIASDRGWVKKIQSHIQKGLSAEAAVQKVRRHTRERYAQIGDSVLKGHLSDLEDLATRLLKHLTGVDTAKETLPESTILVARNLGPAELLDYDRRFIKGLILEEGVHTAHVAIIARALDIPVVGRIPLLLTHVNNGDKLVVNGKKGTVLVNPDADALQAAREKIIHMKKWQVIAKEIKDKPCKTLDGIPISVTLNAGLPIDLQHLEAFSFESVGLYRTEIPFMMRSSFPDVATQTEIYQDVFDHTKGLPITFRTLDIGGDKVVPYMWQLQDENPVLGWRAIRVTLDKPAILRQQIRALLHASHGSELRLLFPMVSDIQEYREARKLAEQEYRRAKEYKRPLPSSISFGVMLEVPSIVAQLDQLIQEGVDFLSLGTNDLFQFFYACDRTNPTVSNRYDTLSSTFLNYLKGIRETCHAAGIPLSLCGEIATQPLDALALMGLGFRTFSIPGPSAGILKKLILTVPLEKSEAFVSKALQEYSPSLRKKLEEFAKENSISI